MNDPLVIALEDCLQALQNGASLDSTLKRYPDLATELRPLLLTAQAAQGVDTDSIPQKAFARGRSHFLAQVNDLRKMQEARKGLSPALRFALITVLVLVFLIGSGNGLVKASASSLPNDPLYGVKRTAEVVQLGLTFNPAQKIVLEEEFSQRRIDETEALLTDKRDVAVKFDGVVGTRLPEGWMVSGIRVVVTPLTEVDGEITSGLHVEVEGVTQDNDTLLAQKIRFNLAGTNPAGVGQGQATETAQPGSGETPNPGGGSPSSSVESGVNGSPTLVSTPGPTNGLGDTTIAAEPTRIVEPTKIEVSTKAPEQTKAAEPMLIMEPTKTEASTKAPEPTQAEEPTLIAEPTKQ